MDSVSQYGRSQSAEGRSQGVPVSLGSQCGRAVWWWQVVGSGPWWYRWPVFLRAFSAVGLSEKGWCQVECVSSCLRLGCTPAPEPPPHSGAPGSRSDTHRYVGGCRSLCSGRGAGSQVLCSGWFQEPKPSLSSTADLHRHSALQVSWSWWSSACCFACGSLWSCAVGWLGASRCAAHHPAGQRRALPSRSLQHDVVLLGIRAWHPRGEMSPWVCGQGSWRMFQRTVQRMHCLLAPPATDPDSSPGTAAAPRPPGQPLHPHSSHLSCPFHCYQPEPAQQSEALKQQILNGPF